MIISSQEKCELEQYLLADASAQWLVQILAIHRAQSDHFYLLAYLWLRGMERCPAGVAGDVSIQSHYRAIYRTFRTRNRTRLPVRLWLPWFNECDLYGVSHVSSCREEEN
jgi:hypothetical protein